MDAAQEIITDADAATTDVVAATDAMDVEIISGGSLSFYSSAADAETAFLPITDAVAKKITTAAAVPSSGSSYYPASAETEVFSDPTAKPSIVTFHKTPYLVKIPGQFL